MKTKRIIYTVLMASMLGIWSGCSSDMLVEHPDAILTSDQVYTNEEGFESGLNGLYSLARQEREGYGYTDSFGATGLYALMYLGGTDMYTNGSGASGEFSAIYKNWATGNVATDKSLTKAFSWLYNAVLAANTIIARVGNDDIAWSSPETPLRIEGEARLIRAWAYRHLTYMWGNVPLNLTETTGENFRNDWEREDISVVRAQIIEDLKFAAEHVGWRPSQIGRATKGVALVWLAEMYLAEAGTGMDGLDTELVRLAWEAADKCIAEGPYELKRGEKRDNGSAFMDMFAPENVNIEAGNTEALWVMQWENNVTGGGDNLMRFSLRPRFDYEAQTAGYEIAAGVGLSYYVESRGGRGYNRASLTKSALELYDRTSDYTEGIIDDRGSEYAIAKYFVLDELDIYHPENGKNPSTGEDWKPGDIIYIGVRQAANVADPTKSTLYGFSVLAASPNTRNWPFTLKYSYCDPGYPKNNESHNDQVFMRLAEAYLLRAEASLKLGDAAAAAADIDELRDRAHALRVAQTEPEGVTLTTILEERSRELLAEEQRRYTLKRTLNPTEFVEWITTRNTSDEGMTERDYLFPIPQSVIDANIGRPMEQNEGFN